LKGYTPVAPLSESDHLDAFLSGERSLDHWLVERALANQVAGFSRTYVTTDGKRVVGYHAVSSFAILRTHATRRAGRQGPQQIPAVLLGRLAVDEEHKGNGLGAGLLRHSMELTVAASDTIGVRLLVVNALHHKAAAFYRRFGFEPSPTNPLDLMITVQDIVASM
jgi:predicted N-acetyltransferase YhbS